MKRQCQMVVIDYMELTFWSLDDRNHVAPRKFAFSLRSLSVSPYRSRQNATKAMMSLGSEPQLRREPIRC